MGTYSQRPNIPRPLVRDVLVEAGHRCAIPTCRQTPVEIAHIVPWRKVKEHTFDNLIALCPTCHARYDNKEIDRAAMLQYKANLSVLNGRYGDLERRVLQHFADHPNLHTIWLPLSFVILLKYLIDDGFLVDGWNDDIHQTIRQSRSGVIAESASETPYNLTDSGRAFIQKWLNAQNLD